MSSLHASNTHKLRRLATLSSVCTSGLGQAPTLLQPMCSYVGHPCNKGVLQQIHQHEEQQTNGYQHANHKLQLLSACLTILL